MDRHTISTVDSEENILDDSSAPTTPDGSLTFSPTLQALRIQDAFEGITTRKGRKDSASLQETLNLSRTDVQNICCIGAGYVGML